MDSLFIQDPDEGLVLTMIMERSALLTHVWTNKMTALRKEKGDLGVISFIIEVAKVNRKS